MEVPLTKERGELMEEPAGGSSEPRCVEAWKRTKWREREEEPTPASPVDQRGRGEGDLRGKRGKDW